MSNKLSADGPSRGFLDLIALIMILATAIMLILLGHMTAGSLVTVCDAVITVYATWSRFRSVQDGRLPPNAEQSADREGRADEEGDTDA